MAIPFTGITRLARNETDLLVARSPSGPQQQSLAVVFTNFKENIGKVHQDVNELYTKVSVVPRALCATLY